MQICHNHKGVSFSIDAVLRATTHEQRQRVEDVEIAFVVVQITRVTLIRFDDTENASNDDADAADRHDPQQRTPIVYFAR